MGSQPDFDALLIVHPGGIESPSDYETCVRLFSSVLNIIIFSADANPYAGIEQISGTSQGLNPSSDLK